jgi:RNAse (barnase) inhibitor barstar
MTANHKRVYEIDGKDFTSLDGFYDAISKNLISGSAWGRNLDAFNDILRGGFGTPQEGFVLRWKNADLSRERLGYPETIRQLRSRLVKCHSDNRDRVAEEIARAEALGQNGIRLARGNSTDPLCWRRGARRRH